MIILQLSALAICAFSTVVRARGAWRGKGVPLFSCFLLMTVSVALSIRPVYAIVDEALGGINITNVLLRVALFIVFFTLGKVIAQAFDSMHVEWLVSGRPGIWVLGFAMGITMASFVLGAYAGGGVDPDPTPAGHVYFNTWRFYLAYVSVCLLVMLLPVAFDPRRSDLYRWSAILQSIGFTMVFVVPFATLAVLVVHAADTFVKHISQLSIIFVASGLMIVWLASWRSKRKAAKLQIEAA